MDYRIEASHQMKFRELVQTLPEVGQGGKLGGLSVAEVAEHSAIMHGLYVPKVFVELSTRRILIQGMYILYITS